ncbi:hypothetical protein RBS60_13060 [Sinomonas sp. ASV486]|uniref:hypothetical protein n=1 Tax=Sinomonas sp. ASV486 TaxID=3051170 RepID=UPI0027DB8D89|nr:hypothetical protein [Sinomonas sp. ASV486]MDQ4491126.1 hypothetical protein [Sinomonas sp. ASV486]
MTAVRYDAAYSFGLPDDPCRGEPYVTPAVLQSPGSPDLPGVAVFTEGFGGLRLVLTPSQAVRLADDLVDLIESTEGEAS